MELILDVNTQIYPMELGKLIGQSFLRRHSWKEKGPLK